MVKMWGIHNDTLTHELVDEGFVSLGWDTLDDLRTRGSSRDDYKRAILDVEPDAKAGAVAVRAGILYRFAHEMREGDVVVAPYRPDSTINIGVVSGPYRYDPHAETHRHRHDVRWQRLGIPRTVFTQPALYEIGSAMTLFRIRKHDDEFRAVLRASSQSVEDSANAVKAVTEHDEADEAISDMPRASRIQRHTRDFVLDRLTYELSHRDFEEFTASLLRAMGYQARATAYTQDGGIDVIAHRDPLGIEPPIIKVQCKHQTGAIGAPEVQRLVGSQSPGELGLFVTLGTYSRDAAAMERQRENLRLLNGEELVDMVLANYDKLGSTWRNRIPLTSMLVVDDAADD